MRLKFFLTLTFVFCFVTLVNAEPIRITSGNVTNSTINISGAGISYNLTVSGGTPVFTFETPYAPGSTIQPTINVFTSNGTTGNTVYNGGGSANFGGGFAPVGSSNMIFTLANGINLPNTFPSPISGINVLSVNVPFTMTGYLVGRSCPPLGPCVDIPGQQLFGNGTATLNFAEFNGTYRLSQYNYSFSSATPEPTPEPTTLILLGTGLLGVLGYSKRKKMKHSDS